MLLHCNYLENSNTLSNSDIIAICAIIVSISSLIISIVYNRKNIELSKKSTILSKKPLILIRYFRDLDNSKVEVGIENNGIGPAIIKKIVYQSKFLESEKNIELFETIKLKDGSGLNLTFKDTYYSEFTNEFSIPENKYIKLYESTLVGASIESKNLFFNHILNCEMTITFTDIFDNEYKLQEKIGAL